MASRDGGADSHTLLAEAHHANDPLARSDKELAALVLDTLKSCVPGVEHVQATVRDRWVTLTGEVPSHTIKRAVHGATLPIPGVAGVTDNIQVSTDILAQAVKQNIEKTMVSDATRIAQDIAVLVDDDKVVLQGRVLSAFERDGAETAARLVPGVGHVVNRLRVVDQAC